MSELRLGLVGCGRIAERGYAPGDIAYEYEDGEPFARRIDPTWAIASGGLVALAGGVG